MWWVGGLRRDLWAAGKEGEGTPRGLHGPRGLCISRRRGTAGRGPRRAEEEMATWRERGVIALAGQGPAGPLEQKRWSPARWGRGRGQGWAADVATVRSFSVSDHFLSAIPLGVGGTRSPQHNNGGDLGLGRGGAGTAHLPKGPMGAGQHCPQAPCDTPQAQGPCECWPPR